MAEQKIQKTLEIRAEYSQALDGIAKYRMELDRAKQEAKAMTDTLKSYDKALKDGSISEAEYAKGVLEVQKQLAANKQEQKQYSDAISTTERVIRNQITAQTEAQDSLKAMRAQLNNLNKEYDELGKSAREGAEGIEKLKAINELTDQIKEAEEATQRYQRNVGNYANSIEEAMQKMGMSAQTNITQIVSSGNSTVDAFLNMATGAEGLKGALSTAGQAAMGLSKQLLAMIATPVGAIIAAIATAFLALKNGIQSSEERMNKFKSITAPLKGVLDGVSKALGVMCGWLLDIAEVTADVVGWVGKLAEKLPLVGDAMAKANQQTREYIAIEQQRQAIVKMTRDEVVKSAEREREVSDLKAKFAEKDKYTNEERLEFLNKAIAIEEEQARKNKEIAQAKYDNLKREASMVEDSTEMLDALKQAEADVIKADTDLSNKLRELNAQRVEAVGAIKAEADAVKKAEEEKTKARQEAYRKQQDELKEQKDTEEQLWRDYEDALMDLIKDSYEKQKLVVATQYQREIEDLKKRLEEEKNLTASAKDAINNIIIAKQQEMNQQIAEINKAQTDEQIQKDAEKIQRQMELDAEGNRLTMEQKMLHAQENTMLLLQLSAEQAEQEHAMEQARIDAEYEMEKQRIANLELSEQEKNERLMMAQQDYNNKSLANDNERLRKQKEIANAEKQAKLTAYNAIKGGIDAMAQHSKAFAIMSKTIALAEIAINTGKAIAAGVSQAMSVPFPANLVAIATTVATVLANVASAISTVKSAKFAKGGTVKIEHRHRYATGGDVRGAGTGTSDSIHAMLSNGESVMTAAATSMYAPVLSAMNQSVGGNPISGVGSAQGEDMLARAMARALMVMPNPVVSVEEINTTSRRVQVIENMASI